MATITINHPAQPALSRSEPLKQWRRKVAAQVMRRRVKSRDFSIISNDCWGGMAYEELGVRYLSPFVGLFVVPEDFARLAGNLRPSLEHGLEFRSQSRHSYLNQLREELGRNYPIGLLPNEVEVHFLHYPDPAAAQAKWQRRAARINWNKLRVKLSWHEYSGSIEALREFEALPIESKLILVPPQALRRHRSVILADFSTDGTQQYWRGHKAFDVAHYLDTGEISRGFVSRLCAWLFYWHY